MNWKISDQNNQTRWWNPMGDSKYDDALTALGMEVRELTRGGTSESCRRASIIT